MLIELTQRQLVLLQFACQERRNAMNVSVERMTNGNRETALRTIGEYDDLVVLLGEHINQGDESGNE